MTNYVAMTFQTGYGQYPTDGSTRNGEGTFAWMQRRGAAYVSPTVSPKTLQDGDWIYAQYAIRIGNNGGWTTGKFQVYFDATAGMMKLRPAGTVAAHAPLADGDRGQVPFSSLTHVLAVSRQLSDIPNSMTDAVYAQEQRPDLGTMVFPSARNHLPSAA